MAELERVRERERAKTIRVKNVFVFRDQYYKTDFAITQLTARF